jgi:transcriptional regulator with XRE-family HTH domain
MIRAQYLRLGRDLSINDVAKATGVANMTISRLEQTEKAGAYDVLVRLAEFFDVKPHELLTPVAPVEEAA